jgi:DNA-binding transcriptional ArsR family regulator
MTEDEATSVFHALAHEHRRRMLDILKLSPGLGVGEVAQEFDVSRIAVMNHLAVLEKAGLIVSEQEGRTRRLYLNAVPIQLIHERWTTEYSAQWAGRMSAIKFMAEAVAKQRRAGKGGASVHRISTKGTGSVRNGEGKTGRGR